MVEILIQRTYTQIKYWHNVVYIYIQTDSNFYTILHYRISFNEKVPLIEVRNLLNLMLPKHSLYNKTYANLFPI